MVMHAYISVGFQTCRFVSVAREGSCSITNLALHLRNQILFCIFVDFLVLLFTFKLQREVLRSLTNCSQLDFGLLF